MTKSILFVCLGNICRSPSAEGVVRKMAQLRGLDLVLDSAGTGAWHENEPPYGPMQKSAAERGYDLSDLRARVAIPEDFGRFDLILAMDQANLRDLRALRPDTARADLCLFTDFAPQAAQRDVPDPYYTRDFDGTLDLIEICAQGLLDQL